MHAPAHLGHQQRLVAQALFGQQGLAFLGQQAAALAQHQHQHPNHPAAAVNQHPANYNLADPALAAHHTSALTDRQIAALPPQLHFLIQLRMASTSASAGTGWDGEATEGRRPLPPERHAAVSPSRGMVGTRRARVGEDSTRAFHTSGRGLYVDSRDVSAASRALHTSAPRGTSYPFPTNPRPTPHQIFHLPVTANQKDVKARYYELVRLHHPDSHNCRHMSAAERHRRFQAITNAYDILRGKKAPESPFDPFAAELARRKRAYAAARRGRQQSMYRDYRDYAPGGDERWKDRVIVTVGVVTFLAGMMPSLITLPSHKYKDQQAINNLKEARMDALKYSEERRQAMRRRADAILDEQSRAKEG